MAALWALVVRVVLLDKEDTPCNQEQHVRRLVNFGHLDVVQERTQAPQMSGNSTTGSGVPKRIVRGVLHVRWRSLRDRADI